MAKKETVRTSALTLPEMIREDLKNADIPFVELKTTPNFRYFLTAETKSSEITKEEWALAYFDRLVALLGERPESFKVNDPKIDVSQAGNYWRLTILIKAVGYVAPKREKMVQTTMDLDEAKEVVEPTVEPEAIVEPEVVEPTIERVIKPATPMPVEKPKRIRKPGIKKAAKETDDVTVAE